MAKNFQEVMDFINSQDEDVVISRQEAIVIAERQQRLIQMSQDYQNLCRAMRKIMAAIEEYKKESEN